MFAGQLVVVFDRVIDVVLDLLRFSGPSVPLTGCHRVDGL